MKLLLIFILTLLSIPLTAGSGENCRCRTVPDTTSSFGGNEVSVTQTGVRLGKQIQGKLTYGFKDGELVKDGIIELFALKASDLEDEAWRIPRSRRRVAACYTNERGRFCLAGLRSGKYLLRAGTSKQEAFNHMHIIIELTRSTGSGISSELEIYLTPAT